MIRANSNDIRILFISILLIFSLQTVIASPCVLLSKKLNEQKLQEDTTFIEFTEYLPEGTYTRHIEITTISKKWHMVNCHFETGRKKTKIVHTHRLRKFDRKFSALSADQTAMKRIVLTEIIIRQTDETRRIKKLMDRFQSHQLLHIVKFWN